MATVLVSSSPIYTTDHGTKTSSNFAAYKVCKTSMSKDQMHSVKDSFESNPSSSPPVYNHSEILPTKQKEKPARGAPIPDGVATGFQKVSDILWDADATKLKFESLGSSSRTDNSVRRTKAEGKKAATTLAPVSRATKPQETQNHAIPVTKADPEGQGHTSRFFDTHNVPGQNTSMATGVTEIRDLSEVKADIGTTSASSKALRSKPIISPAKKKQLTVTGKAIEEFLPEETPDTLSLLEYFPVTASKTEGALVDAKPKPKTSRQTKKPMKRSSLLLPSDALQSLDKQKFVFNTSSQLLGHSSSPTYETMSNGPQEMSSKLKLTRDDSFVDIDSLTGPANVMGFKSTKSLWSAAIRNEDGSVMTADVIDLTEAPMQVAMGGGLGTTKVDNRTVLNMEDVSDQQNKGARGRDTVPSLPLEQPTSALEKSIPSLARSLGEAATRQRQTSRSPVKKKRRTKQSEVKPVKPEDGFKKVSFNDLKEEVKSFGHKPPRSRAKAVELILQCRALQAENQLNATAVPQNGLGSCEATATKVVFADSGISISDRIDEQDTSNGVPDTTIEHQIQTVLVSSQHKEKPRLISKPDEVPDNLPPPSFQAPADHSSSHENIDEASTAILISGIQQAIIAQPPTHSISNPSWKEKIAMYDPIVLEELTTWLNTGGLDAVGIDAEVWPTLVRDWCESRSVCFIWASGGWRKN